MAWPGMASPTSSRQDEFVTTDSIRLHFVRAGAGQSVVLLHGNEGTLQDFTLSIFDTLAASHETLAFDRPGHGLSEAPKHMASPEVQARILHDALLQLKISRPLLVAHSWSGALALSYALQFPKDLCGIVLLGGVAYDTKDGAAKPSYYAARLPLIGTALALLYKSTNRQAICKQLDEAFAPDPAPKWYVERFLDSMFRLSELKAAASDEITLNPVLRKISPSYDGITVPVTIVAGDHDLTVPPQNQSCKLHKAIPGSRLIMVKNAGHQLQFTRPEEVLRAIDLALQAPVSITSRF